MLDIVGLTEIVEYGDAGLLVTFRHDEFEDRWRAAQNLQAVLLARRNAGVVDVVASFETVFVSFDPARTDHTAVADLIAWCADRRTDLKQPQLLRVPAVYGGERGPDLSAAADELGIKPAELVDLHTSSPWTVRFRGSPVASPMMDGPTMPASIARNAVPRVRLEPGSVAVSGQQCLIYPVASPGGWRLIGQTPVQLLDLAIDGLVPYRPGDQLHFYPITEDQWDQFKAMPLVAEPSNSDSGA
jgi:KipI family sensor histidine kinase inhibitor